MCGIVGLHALAPDRQGFKNLMDAMNRVQIHRGPDGEGAYADKSRCLGLAVRRLAILDIPGGSQPMRSSRGRIVVASIESKPWGR
jgi:asparagine synthase (glutamine-hydrolysing)